MLKSTLKTIGRILIILVVAGVIVAVLSALTSSTGQSGRAFDGNFGTRGLGERAGGASAFGLLELFKNIGVISLITMAFWQIQKSLEQAKRRDHIAA